jgi:glucose-1-phosphate cytidylyltransferase
MKVVILCGGKGTRLREETEYRPKPLVPIGGMPILWHIMKIYSHYGFNEFVLCLGYRGDMIRKFFLNYEEMTSDFTLNLRSKESRIIHHNTSFEDWKITFVDTGQQAEIGDRIAQIEPYVRGESFFLTYGDGLANVDLQKLQDFHRTKGKTLTLTGVCPESVYGIVEHEDGLAKSFKEKPRVETTINGGFFICEPGVFKYIQEPPCVFEQAPMRALAADNEIAVYEHRDFWYCMDTHKHYLELNKRWEQGRAPWRIWD